MTRDNQIVVDAWIRIGIALFLLVGGIGGFAYLFKSAFGAERVRCTFDRNEPRKGEAGDGLDGKPVNGWWWDIYKCTDGTERRVLVAGPRG